MKRSDVAIILAVVLPVGLIAALVVHYGVNIPYWDEWEWADLVYRMHAGSLTFADIWAQHSEHRILISNVLMLTLDRLHGWNGVTEQLVSVAIVAFSLLVLWTIIKRTVAHNVRIPVFVATALLLCGLCQWENFSWGFQMGWFLCTLGFTSVIALLSAPQRSPRQFTAAVVIALATSYVSGQGLIIWPVGLVCITLVRRSFLRSATAWIICAAFAIAVYKSGMYVVDFGHVSVTGHLRLLCLYALSYLGAPLATSFGVPGCVIAGSLAIAAFTAFVVSDVLRPQRVLHLARRAPWYALAAYPLIAALGTAPSRAGLGLVSSVTGRYTTISSLFYVALICLAATMLRRKTRWRTLAASAATAAFVCAILVGDWSGLNFWRIYAHQRRLDFAALSRADVSGLADDYPQRDRLTLLVNEIRSVNEGPFYGR